MKSNDQVENEAILLTEIDNEIQALLDKKKAILDKQVDDDLQMVRKLIEKHNFTAAACGFRKKRESKTGEVGDKIVKYKHPTDENIKGWTGRGRQPDWLKNELSKGKKLEEFEVKME